MTLEAPDLTGSPGEACPREGLTSPCGSAAIMFAGRRTPDAGRRTPDAGRRTPLPASSAWDGSRPLASPPDPNASPGGRCVASRPPRPVRRAPAFSTNGSVLFAAGAHPAARRLCRGLATTLLALPPLETTRPEVAQTAPRHSARLTTTPGDRPVPRRRHTPHPRRHHRGSVFGYRTRLAGVLEGHPRARSLHDGVHGDRPDQRHAPRLLRPKRRALRRHLRRGRSPP